MLRIVIFLLCSALLCGCDNSDIRETEYVRAISFNGSYCTLDFYNEESEPVTVKSENPDKICELAELQLGKRIFTGHTELVILKSCNYVRTLEYMLNDFHVSPNCLIAYGNTDFENNSSELLTAQIKHQITLKKISECDLITTLGNLLNDKHSAILPHITFGETNGTVSISG